MLLDVGCNMYLEYLGETCEFACICKQRMVGREGCRWFGSGVWRLAPSVFALGCPWIACHSFFISCKAVDTSAHKRLRSPYTNVKQSEHCMACVRLSAKPGNCGQESVCLTERGLIGSQSKTAQSTVYQSSNRLAEFTSVGVHNCPHNVFAARTLKSGAGVPDFQAKHDRPVKLMSKKAQIIMSNGQKCGITRNGAGFHQNMIAEYL